MASERITYVIEKEFQSTARGLVEAYGWAVFCTCQSKHSLAPAAPLADHPFPKY